MTLLIKNVKYLVTCDDDNRVLKEVNVFVEDGIIKSIGADVQTADDVIDGSHMVMYPGLINTHHHLYQTFSRNLPEVQNMELFPWLKTLYEIWKNLNPDTVYYSSLTGMGELLKTGCTCCLDHHYVFPAGTGMDCYTNVEIAPTAPSSSLSQEAVAALSSFEKKTSAQNAEEGLTNE